MDYTEYIDSDECEFLSVELANCLFEGHLLQRKNGGFDLCLFRENSEFEGLEISQVTWLRQQAQGEEHLFIERFPDTKVTKDARKRVEERFLKWLENNLGLHLSKAKVRWNGEETGFWPWS